MARTHFPLASEKNFHRKNFGFDLPPSPRSLSCPPPDPTRVITLEEDSSTLSQHTTRPDVIVTFPKGPASIIPSPSSPTEVFKHTPVLRTPKVKKPTPYESRYILKELERCYAGEEKRESEFGKHYEKETGEVWHVEYLSPAQRRPYWVRINSSGKLIDANNQLLTTTSGRNFGGAAMFVMDRNGDLFVSMHEEDGKFQHSSLVAGEHLAMAGEIRVERGRITYINNASGHYKPSKAQMNQFINRLRDAGAPLSGVEVGLFGQRPIFLKR